MKALNNQEIEQLRKEKYPQFGSKADFVYWLKKQNWVTVTNRGHKRKRYQVCETAFK